MLRVIPEDGAQRRALQLGRPVELRRGFHAREWDGENHFRWMGGAGVLGLEPVAEPSFLELSVRSSFADLSQVLTVAAGEVVGEFPLIAGWMQLSVSLPAHADEVVLELNKLFPRHYYPGDARSLGAQVRGVRHHRQPERHGHVTRQHANALLNTRELLDGATRLESTPPALGIDMYGVCNVKPPCVYCEWDASKDLEGANVDTPFTAETLREYGAFFDNAHELTNCSIGEPFMMRNFDALLDVFGSQGKVLELTTNGQILTDRNIERLLGRTINLYISLDAGTAATYAKLRNDTFDKILANIRRLVEARKAAGGLPRIHIVFMPMRVNLHELEACVELCADLEVDRLVLRPLNFSEWIDLRWQRDGYTFDYQNELLPFDELVAASARAAEHCARYGVVLSDQMDFGGVESGFVAEFAEEGGADSAAVGDSAAAVEAEPPPAAVASESVPEAGDAAQDDVAPSLGQELEPICTEPWRKLYILRRGVLPCSYGGSLGAMQDYREVWNSEEMAHIRSELAAGRFPQYCLEAPSCPIVRRSIHGGKLPLWQSLSLGVSSRWHRFARATSEGWKSKLAWPVKAPIGLALEARRDPAAAARRVARRLGFGARET